MAKPGLHRRRWPYWLGGIAALIIVLVSLFDWNWFKSLVERKATAALNRQVTIANMHVALRRTPLITFDRVVLADPPEFPNRAHTAEIEQIALTLDLERLLHGVVRIPELTITHPTADLRREGETANWEFGNANGEAETASSSSFPEIGRLVITDGGITLKDPKNKSDLKATLRTEATKDGSSDTLIADAEGTVGGDKAKLRYQGDSILSLRDQDHPYQLAMDAVVGRTRTAIKGSVTRPLAFAGFKMDLDLSGPDLALLYPVIGIPTPPTPPYRLKGALEYEDKTFRFRNFTGTVGSSDLAGDLEVKTGDRVPYLSGQLHSKKVVLADLAGFIGAAPGKADAPNATAERKRQEQQAEAKDRILPDTTIDTKALRAIDADIDYKAERIETENWPLDNIQAKLAMRDGRLTLKPLRFGIGKGGMIVDLDLDGRQDPPKVVANVDFRNIDLKRIMAKAKGFEGAGTIGGKARLTSRGNSTASILGNGDGDLTLVMGGGSFSKFLIEVTGLDVTEALGFAAESEDKQTPIRCMVGDFGMSKGVLQARTLVFDTGDTNVTGEGTVNLKDETLDLTISPHPKDVSILTFRTPIIVRGKFKSPGVFPEPTQLGARTGASIALGILLTPLAALIPTIELGLGEDSDCKGLIEQARRAAANPGKGKQSSKTN